MEAPNKANLFVVGAMRAGTTSFMELLSSHPDIYVSPIKEPHFFTETLPEAIFEPQPDSFLNNYFKKQFPAPIHRAHVKDQRDYNKLFKNGSAVLYRAEGSVSYLHAPNAVTGIQQYNPEAKIIVLTRDPLQRAQSQYLMDKGLFRENRSFEEVLTTEIEAYNKGKLPWYSTLGMSFYKKPISNFERCFPDNVLVLSLEDFVTKPSEAIESVALFLEISSFTMEHLPNLNKNKELRFRKIFRIFYKGALAKWLISSTPSLLKKKLKRIFFSERNVPVQVSENLYTTLESIFKKEC